MSSTESFGQPSLPRPDLALPAGWDLRVLSTLETVRNHALSPDGEWIAFIWDRDDLSDIYIMPSSGGWPARLTTGRGPVIGWDDEIPAWSHDSQQLAFTDGGGVQVCPVSGGLPVRVTEFIPDTSSPEWVPGNHRSPGNQADNRELMFSLNRKTGEGDPQVSGQLYCSDLQGRQITALTDDADGNSFDARVSPDGRLAAFIFRHFNDLKRYDLRLVDLHSGEIRTLCQGESLSNHTPRWRPDGAELAFLSQQSGYYQIWLVKQDGSDLRQLTDTDGDLVTSDLADIAWSPDGRQIACTANRQGALELVLVEATSGKVETLRGGLGVHSRPNWSPDGSFITFEYQDALNPNDIYRLELGSGECVRLTHSKVLPMANLKLVVPERVTFPSPAKLDPSRSTNHPTVDIPAFLYRARNPNGAGLLYLHGGPSSQYLYEWDIFLQYLVASGYTVLCPNYRGSTGYGLDYERLNDFDWGGGDVQDCLAAADFLASLPEVDPARLAPIGPSYGGYLTNCLLAWDPQRRFACGVSLYGDSNLLTSWALCSLRLRHYTEAYLGNPAFNREVYRKGSPVQDADKVHAPLLLLHGLLDDIVPPQGSQEWAKALREAGKTYEFTTYPEEPHGLLHQENRLDAWGRIERFLNWYLMPVKTGDDPGKPGFRPKAEEE